MIENATKIAEKKGFFIKYQVGDATNLRFADNIFDGVLFSNQGWTQIFGKENRLTAFREIHRVLKPKGYFLFTTHVRKWRGFTFFWFWQWVKLRILKPLGFPVDEEEWGDRFFNKETSAQDDIPHYEKQYIHIPSVGEVKQMLAAGGFHLQSCARASEIAGKRGRYSPMFYICRK